MMNVLRLACSMIMGKSSRLNFFISSAVNFTGPKNEESPVLLNRILSNLIQKHTFLRGSQAAPFRTTSRRSHRTLSRRSQGECARSRESKKELYWLTRGRYI